MILDIRTLLVVSVLLLAMMGIALFLTWRVNRSIVALRHWAIGYLLLAAGLAATGLRDPEPSVPALLASNVLVGAAPAAIWLGVRAFLNKPSPWRPLALLYAVMLAAMLVLSAVLPNMAARVAVGSVYAGILSALCAVDLLRAAGWSPCSAMGTTGSLFALHTVFYGVRLVMTFSAGALPEVLEPTVVQTWTFLEAPVVALAVGIAFIIMTTERLQDGLRHLATYDALTGVLNRRAFFAMAEGNFTRLGPGDAPFSLLLLDVDHFKSINDHFGHQAGDAVLKAVSRAAQSVLRANDLFGRYGGEEFCALLPATTLHQAQTIAERLRTSLGALSVEHGGAAISITVSIGVAEGGPGTESLDTVVADADAALYKAKAGGRNQTVVHRPQTAAGP